jgi:flagellar basal-body rod protein FlgB
VLDPIADRIEHYMDLLATRQQLVASNIANADTPGYKTKDLDFQFEFMSLIKGGTPNVSEVSGLPPKNDGNNVSMDRESRLLAENAIRFNLASNLMKMQLTMLREAIQEKSGA